MATGFVIKKLYKNGTSEYFQEETLGLFNSNIYFAYCFDSYEEAEAKIKTMEGLFQIEKIFYN